MEAEPAVEPLSRLEAGTDARVVSLALRDTRRLLRLGSLGLAPGARLHVQQTSPTFVLRIRGTVFAFERELADAVYVQRAGDR